MVDATITGSKSNGLLNSEAAKNRFTSTGGSSQPDIGGRFLT